MVELLKREGGLVAYAGRLLTSIGWSEVEDPEPGDIGIIDLPRHGKTCVICVSAGSPARWMARGDGIVLIAPGAHLAAWRKPCHSSSRPLLRPSA